MGVDVDVVRSFLPAEAAHSAVSDEIRFAFVIWGGLNGSRDDNPSREREVFVPILTKLIPRLNTGT
jgi:hypothetical protein